MKLLHFEKVLEFFALLLGDGCYALLGGVDVGGFLDEAVAYFNII